MSAPGLSPKLDELPERLRPIAEILTKGFASTLAAVSEAEQRHETARQKWLQRKSRRTGL